MKNNKMGFKKKLKKKLKGIIKSYEDGSKLEDYAQGRLANTKMILDIVEKMDYIPCRKTLPTDEDCINAIKLQLKESGYKTD